MAKTKAATKPQAQGVGESKRFADASKHEPGIDWAKLTINGEPIPQQLWDKMPYKLTDQGAIEANGGRPVKVSTVEEILDRRKATSELEKAHATRRSAQDKGLPVPRDAARTIANAARQAGVPLDDKENFQGAVEAFEDGLLNDYLVTETDSQSMIMNEWLPEGHRGLWMSKQKTAREGMVRGILRYRQVFKPNGDPVENGNMFLASVPIAAHDRQQEHLTNLNKQLQVSAVNNVREQTDRIQSVAGMTAAARKRHQDGATDGFISDDAATADRELIEQFAHAPNDDD